MVDPTPNFSVGDAERIAQEHFNLAASALNLPSERDQNFALKTAQGRQFVLKIAKADEERSVLELQNAVLHHVADRATDLEVSRLVASASGDEIIAVMGPAGTAFLVRLVTWLDGVLWAQTPRRDEACFRSLGARLAQLDEALEDFSHPAMNRMLHWDLKHANHAFEHLPLLTDAQRRVVDPFIASWKCIDWRSLRHAVIHGDANDYNVLIRGGEVVAFLDFGDMVHSAVACDLAVALAYAMLDEQNPLVAAQMVVKAYHERYPLTPAELKALFPLITTRLCMSLCHAAHNLRAKSHDAYQQVTSGPAWILLQRLAPIPAEEAARRIMPS